MRNGVAFDEKGLSVMEANGLTPFSFMN